MVLKLHTVVETAPFLRKAGQLGVSEAERLRIVDEVASDPVTEAGEVLAGHVRKRRMPGRRGGKSGGYRIAVAYFGPDVPVYLLAILSKREADMFTVDEKKRIAEAADEIAAAVKGTRR